MSIALTSIDRVSADIASILKKRGLIRDSILLTKCYGHKQCQRPYCIKCLSRRVYKQRKHLEKALPAIIQRNPGCQLWFLTGAAEDSDAVNTHAKAVVRGMRRLLKHDRLRSRVISHFSVLEVATKRGRKLPCAHVHTLLVTKPIDVGRHRISEPDWIRMWEAACPQARKRDLTLPLKRKQPKNPTKHPSFLVIRAGVTEDDLTRLIQYCTKWATPKRITRNYRQLLANPDAFIHRIDSLKGVTRFFGALRKA